MFVLRFVMEATGVIPCRCRRRKRQRETLHPKLLLQKFQMFHGAAAAEVQQNQRQKLLGVRVAFILSDAYGSIDELRKLELIPKFDYGK